MKQPPEKRDWIMEQIRRGQEESREPNLKEVFIGLVLFFVFAMLVLLPLRYLLLWLGWLK